MTLGCTHIYPHTYLTYPVQMWAVWEPSLSAQQFLVKFCIPGAPRVPSFLPWDFGNDLSRSPTPTAGCRPLAGVGGVSLYIIVGPQPKHWGAHERHQTYQGLMKLSVGPGRGAPWNLGDCGVPRDQAPPRATMLVSQQDPLSLPKCLFSPKMLKQKWQGKEMRGSPLDDLPYCFEPGVPGGVRAHPTPPTCQMAPLK